MKQLLADLLKQAPVVTDGAWGTQLQSLGLSATECPDSWNLTHPDRVQEVGRRYVEAGSRVILTNTFRSNRISLAGFGLGESVAEINRAGVRLSRAAAGNSAKVFASIGPTGRMLMTGEISPEETHAAFLEQALALAEGGADALLIETMSDLEEAKIALAAAQTTGLPVAVSMVFDSGKDHDRTMMGLTVEHVAKELTAAGADVIGANCGLGIEGYLPIGKRLRTATSLPVWIKPNAGLPELVEGTIVYRVTPDWFADQALSLRDAGVHFLGGCCGTSPDFISALSGVLARPSTR